MVEEKPHFTYQSAHFVHFIFRFSYAKATYGITGAVAGGDEFGRSLTEVLIGTTLNDRKQRLFMTVGRLRVAEALNTTVEPAMGKVHRLARVTIIRRIGRAFIKCHNNIGPDGALNIHHIFWCEKMAGAINM